MSTVNKLKNAWINTDTSLSGTYQTCSLLNNGASEFAGNVVIDNKLAINRAVDNANDYKLDISGNSRISDLVISNKNKLSNVQYVSTAITLTFNSGEYVAITSSFPNGGYITMPVVTSSSQFGTKFSFFFSSDVNPDVSIFAGSGQFLCDNLYSIVNGNINLSYSRTFIELVCTSLTSPQWSQSNGSNDYQLFPQLIGVNNWSSNNYFNTILPTSTITTFNNNNQFVTKYYADGLITTLKSSANAWTSTNTFNTSLPTSTLTPSSNTQLITKVYADGLITTLKSSANTWSSTNTFNTSLPTSTLTPTTNTQLVTKSYVDSNLSSYQTITGMSSYLTSATASTTYQTITDMSSYLTTSSASTTYQTLTDMSNYVLQSYLDANYNTSAYINNNFASLSGTNTFLGGGSFGGALAFKGNTSIINSKTFEISSGSTFNCNSGSTANLNGTTNINANGYWNVSSGGSFLLQGNGVTFLELGPLALYSPISFSTNLNQTTFNGYIVFKSGFTIEGGQTIGIGTSGYGTGFMQVAGNGSYINIQSSGGFFSNWIEPTSTTSSASWFTTSTSTLTFGNSDATLINNFASNTFVTLPSTTTAITSANTDNFITKRIANLLYCGVQSPTIFTPTFKITAPFIPSGEIISTFSNDAGDTILVRNIGYGLTPNAMCIDTAQANGLSLNANTSTASINFHIAKTLIAKIVSTGLSITGNISFTGSLGSITQTIFGKIATAFGKQTFAEQATVITANTTLSAPFSQIYGVNNGATTPITITLPQAAIGNVGVTLLFRRLAGSTSTTIINMNTTGATQVIYTGNNGSSTLVSVMASGVFINRVTSLYNGTSYNWYFN
jgi:hypothetical protein